MFRRRVIGSINISNVAIVTCESKTYNGQTQVATNITVAFKGETLTEGVDYIVTENNGGTNVGLYTVKIKGIKKYSGNEQGPFSIMKVTPTVTVPTPRTSLVYNGSNQALIAAGSTDWGTLKYSLDDSTYSTSIPSGTNATSYTVYYKVEGDSNVNDVPAQSVSVSIGKVTPTVVAPTAKVLTYNGSQQELVNSGSTNFGTLQYRAGSDSWSTSIPTRQKGGSYVVQYKVVGDSNINDVAAESVQCSINEKQVTATVTLSQTAYTYNGSACQPTPTVKDGSTVIDPSEYSVTYSNNINAGTGTVTISDNAGGDYEVIGSATFTINKADPTYTAPTTKTELVYNANAQALLNSGSATGGTIYYSSDNSTWSTAIPSGTNATSYTSYWKITGDSNHNDKASASISTTISKANSSLSFSVTNITVENGQTKTNAVTVNAGDGTVTYTSNNTSIVTVNNSGVVTGVGVGNTTVTANISSSSNYNSASTSYTANCAITVITKFNVNSTSSPTRIASGTTSFTSIEIDGVTLSPRTGYTFSTTGEHTVKYYLTNTTIGSGAFGGCSGLTSFTIGSGVTSIGSYAFEGCSSLTSVAIPDSVTSIGNNVFWNCRDLANITIDSNNSTYDSRNNCNAIVETSTNKLIVGCRNTIIPNTVTSIGGNAFVYCSGLTSIYIPDSVISIGSYAFNQCTGLISCTIGSGVTSIGGSAFGACTSLTSVTIPDSVTSIGDVAFAYCSSLTSVTIGSGVTSIGSSAFEGCSSLTSITSNASTAPTISSYTFAYIKTGGTLTVLAGSTGYNVWMGTGNYYLGKYKWTKVEV